MGNITQKDIDAGFAGIEATLADIRNASAKVKRKSIVREIARQERQRTTSAVVVTRIVYVLCGSILVVHTANILYMLIR